MNTTTETLTQKRKFFPFCLSDEEILQPMSVLNDFFDCSDLREETDRIGRLLEVISRSDSYFKNECHELVNTEYRRLIEAVFLLVHNTAREEISVERFLALFANEIKLQLEGASLAVESLIDKTDSFFADKPDVAFYLTTLKSILFNSTVVLKNMINTVHFREEYFAFRSNEAPFKVLEFIDECTIPYHVLNERFGKNLLIELNELHNKTIVTDKVQLGRVIQNFLNNAYRYGKGEDIQLIATGSNDHVSFSVVSSGETISAREIKRLMNIYYHAGDGDAGYGIGLYLCEVYAESLGGNIKVTSHDGFTSFTIHIPCEIRD